ncbi:MAG: 50S ribosomal protein L10 [Opitutales bacterium]
MRPEKEYMVEAVDTHLGKSDYVYLTNYERITVEETATLRDKLSENGAEFHVVKNSILNVAARRREMPDLAPWLDGPTAIIIGGNNPSGVAKTLRDFFKEKDKVEIKGGVMSDKTLSAEEIDELSKLPGLEVLRAQLLGLLNQPARGLVTVMNAVPVSVVNLLQAKVRAEGGED